jgi:hypothetical protein
MQVNVADVQDCTFVAIVVIATANFVLGTKLWCNVGYSSDEVSCKR